MHTALLRLLLGKNIWKIAPFKKKSTPPPQPNNNKNPKQKPTLAFFACGCYTSLLRDYLWHGALKVAASCITRLQNKPCASQAAGSDPRQWAAIAATDIVCSVLWECSEPFQNWRLENGVKETVGKKQTKKKKKKIPTADQSCTFGFKWKRYKELFQNLVSKLLSLFTKKEKMNAFSPGGSSQCNFYFWLQWQQFLALYN